MNRFFHTHVCRVLLFYLLSFFFFIVGGQWEDGHPIALSDRWGLEWESTESTTRLTTAESAASESTAATTVHHVEQDVGIDIDMGTTAAHTTHSSHPSHTAHATAHATTEHVSRVDKVVTVVVGSTFSVEEC